MKSNPCFEYTKCWLLSVLSQQLDNCDIHYMTSVVVLQHNHLSGHVIYVLGTTLNVHVFNLLFVCWLSNSDHMFCLF